MAINVLYASKIRLNIEPVNRILESSDVVLILHMEKD